VRLHLANQTGGPYESRNVVAEIKGRERPDEIVVLGAHLDSWDLGAGAEDNGANDGDRSRAAPSASSSSPVKSRVCSAAPDTCSGTKRKWTGTMRS
jgi:hypothetical protein